jgi:hypothetical protein
VRYFTSGQSPVTPTPTTTVDKSMADFFSGIENTKQEGASKGQWFRDGDYLVEIQSFTARASEHPDRKGQGVAIVECNVLEVLRDAGEGNPSGTKVAWFNVLERAFDGNLTAKGERAMGRIKNFASAALGLSAGDESAITANTVGKLTQANPKAKPPYGEGEALKGLRLRAEVNTRTSQKTGKAFTNVVWFAVPESE